MISVSYTNFTVRVYRDCQIVWSKVCTSYDETIAAYEEVKLWLGVRRTK